MRTRCVRDLLRLHHHESTRTILILVSSPNVTSKTKSVSNCSHDASHRGLAQIRHGKSGEPVLDHVTSTIIIVAFVWLTDKASGFEPTGAGLRIYWRSRKPTIDRFSTLHGPSIRAKNVLTLFASFGGVSPVSQRGPSGAVTASSSRTTAEKRTRDWQTRTASHLSRAAAYRVRTGLSSGVRGLNFQQSPGIKAILG